MIVFSPDVAGCNQRSSDIRDERPPVSFTGAEAVTTRNAAFSDKGSSPPVFPSEKLYCMYRRPRRAAMCRVAVGFDGWVGKVVGLSAHERWRWVRA
jgi:hypothetical protein